MKVIIKDDVNEYDSTEEFGHLLDEIDTLDNVEAWLNAPNGAAICLLKSEENAVLIYLRQNGDSGFHSIGESTKRGNFDIELSNGQLDEYPLAWCVETESAYKALAYFFENEGERPSFINWHKD